MQASFSYRRPVIPGAFLFAVVIFAALMILLAVLVTPAGQMINLATSHGEAAHGWSAVHVRECIERNGPMQTWFNPETGRRGFICQLDETTFGVQILFKENGMWNSLTEFVKDKLKTLGQVERYMENAGYVKIIK
jgi:hypothetical protein